MKIFIFTYDRYDSISTSQYFKNIPHTILCHTEQDKQKFLDAGNCYGEIISTNNPKGLSYNRNAALDMMDENEWAIFFVDDLISVTGIPYNHDLYFEDDLGVGIGHNDKANYAFINSLFKTKIKAEDFLIHCKETIKECENKGYALGGFSLTNNTGFRSKKYSYKSLADGRCWVVKKTDLRFDENVQLIDDVCFTAQNILKFGGVVVNNYVLPECKRYTDGAFGSIGKRMEQKLKECKYLVTTYPDVIAYADKTGWEKGSHVKIRNKKINHNQVKLF